ncbi:MAG: elongation factor P--(R)-beta-lysine ligase [Pseudomonadota bacterium]|nr:elongation factor P--(R)-beta-lysine ligase [Pseudomonadota bacterium]
MFNAHDWQPTATINALKQRAEIIKTIRDFFYERGVLEVETPLLCYSSTIEPHLHSFHIPGTGYLQTSPEFAMKRLLAANSGPIYQLGKAFRAEESGRNHNREFTLLEWYRPGFDHHQLMDEIDALIITILKCEKADRKTYQSIFLELLNIDPLTASIAALQDAAAHINAPVLGDDRDAWLQLLMSHAIEPNIGQERPIFIYDFPASQAALAKINPQQPQVADRFELYFHGLELVNGYHELTDAAEQHRRFIADNATRRNNQLPELPIDMRLLTALAQPFPECAGVALGVDRVIMLALAATHIEDVISFTESRA